MAKIHHIEIKHTIKVSWSKRLLAKAILLKSSNPNPVLEFNSDRNQADLPTWIFIIRSESSPESDFCFVLPVLYKICRGAIAPANIMRYLYNWRDEKYSWTCSETWYSAVSTWVLRIVVNGSLYSSCLWESREESLPGFRVKGSWGDDHPALLPWLSPSGEPGMACMVSSSPTPAIVGMELRDEPVRPMTPPSPLCGFSSWRIELISSSAQT